MATISSERHVPPQITTIVQLGLFLTLLDLTAGLWWASGAAST